MYNNTQSLGDNTYTSGYAGPVTATDIRSVQSQVEFEHLEKTLSHLGGRVQELMARMDAILLPEPSTDSKGQSSVPEPARSPYSSRLNNLHKIANSVINDVESMLNRLDL